jgi:hypothetical protein
MKFAPNPGNVDCLFYLKYADMQSTADQELLVVGGYHQGGISMPFEKYKITDIIAVCNNVAVSVACAGGIYTAAAKGGTAVVAAGQSWLGLTAADTIVRATLAAACDTNVFTLPNSSTGGLFLSLTTGSTAAGKADFYVYGYVLN